MYGGGGLTFKYIRSTANVMRILGIVEEGIANLEYSCWENP